MTSYYAVERSSNSLSHYGVKGMRWGIRKNGTRRGYQNSDGSLKPRAKAKIAKSSYLTTGYRKPKRGTENRREVSLQFVKEYNSQMKKLGLNPEQHEMPAVHDKAIWDKYKDPYASATLKDLRMKDTKRARNSVKAIYRSTDPFYDYDKASKLTEKKERAYYQRRKELVHPTRTKIRNAGKKAGRVVKESLGVLSNAKNLARK